MKLLLNFFLIATCATAQSSGTVDGQIYITTKGRDTIKMSLTSVMLVETSKANKQLERAMLCYSSKRKMDALEKRMNGLVAAMPKMSAEQKEIAQDTWKRLRAEYIVLMPDGKNGKKPLYQLLSEQDWKPETTSQTDSEGNFRVQLPSTTNQWTMVAFSRRMVGRVYEEYIWIVPVRSGQVNQLNNSNLLQP